MNISLARLSKRFWQCLTKRSRRCWRSRLGGSPNSPPRRLNNEVLQIRIEMTFLYIIDQWARHVHPKLEVKGEFPALYSFAFQIRAVIRPHDVTQDIVRLSRSSKGFVGFQLRALAGMKTWEPLEDKNELGWVHSGKEYIGILRELYRNEQDYSSRLQEAWCWRSRVEWHTALNPIWYFHDVELCSREQYHDALKSNG